MLFSFFVLIIISKLALLSFHFFGKRTQQSFILHSTSPKQTNLSLEVAFMFSHFLLACFSFPQTVIIITMAYKLLLLITSTIKK